MYLNHFELVHKHPAHLASHVKIKLREGSVQSNHPKLTPCYLCCDVVREGSRRFDALEPPRTSA